MCGIGGYLDFNRRISPAILDAMTMALGRRGPDAQGISIDGPCGLAHARLSIIDVAGSPQPMSAPEVGLQIVYNGEVYNYLELRRELQAKGHSFSSAGDTEVLLRLIADSWIENLYKLDAMFAFGAWDGKRQRLLLGRDPMGEKPLFYANPAPGVLVFGSEVKVVLEHPAVSRELNLDALRQAMRFRAVYGSESLHLGVRQLEPGCWLEFSRDGLKTGRFHSLIKSTQAAHAELRGLDDRTLVARGKQLFIESVEQRLVADANVPVGSFLSGGLDSSLIVATMRRLRPDTEIRTFSVGFADDPHSELPFAKTVADGIGARHTPIGVGPEAYVRRFAELSACRDGPVSQPADIAIAEMSHVAKQSVKVVLSGEGADEVFAGYPKYGLANVPWPIRRAMTVFGPTRAAGLAGRLGLDRRRALVAARALSEPTEVDRHAQWFSYFDREDLQRLLPGLEWQDLQWERTTASQSAALVQMGNFNNLTRMQTTDCLTWLPGNMLERGDRMTMAEGLEVRPPFLDTELCAFGLALPSRLKVRGRTGKWIVRQWATDLVPEGILARRKWGFRTPLEAWFRGPMRDFLIEYITAKNGLCDTYGDQKEVVRMLDDHQDGTTDAGEALWTLLSAEVWYQDVYVRRLRERPAVTPNN
jgi:asparagine synthase (glutamine-hydrolysing)